MAIVFRRENKSRFKFASFSFLTITNMTTNVVKSRLNYKSSAEFLAMAIEEASIGDLGADVLDDEIYLARLASFWNGATITREWCQ